MAYIVNNNFYLGREKKKKEKEKEKEKNQRPCIQYPMQILN